MLVDLERHYGAGRTLIGHAELMRVIEADGIEIEPGDMLVLRTGYAEAVVAMNGQPDADTLHSYGAALDGTDEALLQWITDSGIAAICADNYAVEAYPARERSGPRPMLPLHHHCLFAGPAAGRTVVSEGPGRLAARQWPPPLHADRAAAAPAARHRLAGDADRHGLRRRVLPARTPARLRAGLNGPPQTRRAACAARLR